MQLKVNRANIQTILADAGMREFAVFLLFKSKLKKSCAYAYTPDTLASKVGLKKGMVRVYVKSFLKRGWCRLHGNNLIFNSLSSMEAPRIKRVKVSFEIKGSVKEIMNDLYLLILKHKQKQFDWLKQLGCDHTSASRKKKKAVRTVSDQNARLQVSIRKIAQWFGCSVGKATAIIKKFKLSRLITVISSDRQVIIKTREKYMIDQAIYLNAGSYYHNGFVFKRPCNSYIF